MIPVGVPEREVDRAAGELPADLPQKPRVEELSSAKVPVMEIHVSGEVSEEALRRTARQLEDGLREVPGIAGGPGPQAWPAITLHDAEEWLAVWTADVGGTLDVIRR